MGNAMAAEHVRVQQKTIWAGAPACAPIDAMSGIVTIAATV